VKYRAAQIQKVTCRWLNLFQWMAVATPSSVANTVTETKPAWIAFQWRSDSTRTKKYAPPRYAEASTIGVIGRLDRPGEQAARFCGKAIKDDEGAQQERDDDDGQYAGRDEHMIVPAQQHLRIIAAVSVAAHSICRVLYCGPSSATRIPAAGRLIGKSWLGQ
jgi:hypothetical protein